MTDKKSIENRRKLLKAIATGSGAVVAGKSLPQSWSRPVVDSVMLPAHAQTSGQYAGAAAEAQASINENSNIYARLVDKLVEPAKADRPTFFYNADLCVVNNGDNTANVEAVVSRSDGYCTFSNRFAVNNVPVGDSAFKPMALTELGCGKKTSIPFINIAFAGPGSEFECAVSVTSVNGTAVGKIKVDELFDGITATLDFSIGIGGCSLPMPVCCPEE